MTEVSTSRDFREFIRYLDREMNATTPYRYLIIEALLRSYPSPLSKKNISDHLRNSLDNSEAFEYMNIWSQLIDKDELMVETDNGFRLSIQNITDDEKNRLLKVCARRIANVESDFNTTTKQNQISSQNFTNNVNNLQKGKSIVQISYYLVHFKNNITKYGDYAKFNEIKKYDLILSRKKMKHFKINGNNRNLVILFDTKADQIRIWGRAEMIQKSQISHTSPNIAFKNYEPLIQNEEIITPKWLLPQDKRESMFGNKLVINIDKNDFDRILNSVVTREDLFPTENTSNSKQLIKENIPNSEAQQSFIPEQEIEHIREDLLDDEKIDEFIEDLQYSEDLPLEIPSKDALENGIKEIQKTLLIDTKTIEEIVIHLTGGRNILLAGPVGTGKTQLSKLIPQLFWKKDGKGFDAQVYTASNEWNVNDVIGGIVPRMKNNKPMYKIQHGCVTETVRKSWNNKNPQTDSKFRGTWLVIDEFNRAEIDKAFGQLFTSLESKILRVPDEQNPTLTEMKIPLDYRIIGTLNTSDKHYLYKLSDALKRRFAYIEVKSPSKKDAQHEIYYALSGAMGELPSEVSSLIQLNTNEKKLANEQSNVRFSSAVRSAYEILSFVRMTKDMGTAILKSIYQSMLIGTQIKEYDDSILDMALSGNIVPQLEKIEATNIEVLLQFCFNDLHTFFHQKYNGTDDEDRQKYSDDFEYYLKFLEISDVEKLKNEFFRKNMSDENWTNILEKWKVQKSNNQIPKNLPMFRNALKDLKKTFEFL